MGWYGWFNLLAAAGLGYATSWTTGFLPAGWAVFAVLAIVLWRFWLPVRYELGPQGIAQTVLGRTSHIPWTAILRFELRPRGVMLYPDSIITPLSPPRGLYLAWGRQKEAVLAHVEYYLTSWSPSEQASRRP